MSVSIEPILLIKGISHCPNVHMNGQSNTVRDKPALIQRTIRKYALVSCPFDQYFMCATDE